MVTIMGAESTLHDIREQVMHSRLSHVPTNFCFLFNGHALDPNVEVTIKASSVAIVANPPDTHGSQYIVLIDNVHCNIAKSPMLGIFPSSSQPSPLTSFSVLCTIIFFVYLARNSMRSAGRDNHTYNRVPSSAHESQALMDADQEKASSDGQRIPCLPGQRIPCLPHNRLRPPMFLQKVTRYSAAKVATSPKTVEKANAA
jgi:hypothetical protein